MVSTGRDGRAEVRLAVVTPSPSLGTIVEVVIGSMSMESSALDERDLRRMLTVAEVLVCSDPQAPSKVGLREFG